MSLIYCYGVIETSESLDIKGFNSKNTYLISFKGLNAVVSEVSENEFSQDTIDMNIKDMKWLTLNGQIHEKVIEDYMESTTIIPMKFCTIFKDKNSVEKMLEKKKAELLFNLTELKGKIEMTVKVYFDSNPLKKKISNEDNKIKELIEQKKFKKTGAAYFDEQKIEILLKEKVRELLKNSTSEISKKINSLGERAKQNELVDKKLTGKDMLLNNVLLLNKENIKEFEDNIEKIKESHKDFEFQIWGPFPPYNFIK